MVWRYGWSGVALSLALVGCSNFVEAETGAGAGDSSGTNGTTSATSTPSTSGQTDSASDGSETTRTTSASNTDPTVGSNTDPSESDTIDPVTSSTTGDTEGTTDPTEGTTGEGTGTTGDETTGPGVCIEEDTEPNDLVGERQDLGAQPCEVQGSFTGTLLDEEDVDQFEFSSPWVEETCGNGEPDQVYNPSGPIELCARPSCVAGSKANPLCETGTLRDVDGTNHCCSTGEVRLDLLCSTFDESSLGYIIILADPDALECAEYSFTYEVEYEDEDE